jgi:hypothetical protein
MSTTPGPATNLGVVGSIRRLRLVGTGIAPLDSSLPYIAAAPLSANRGASGGSSASKVAAPSPAVRAQSPADVDGAHLSSMAQQAYVPNTSGFFPEMKHHPPDVKAIIDELLAGGYPLPEPRRSPDGSVYPYAKKKLHEYFIHLRAMRAREKRSAATAEKESAKAAKTETKLLKDVQSALDSIVDRVDKADRAERAEKKAAVVAAAAAARAATAAALLASLQGAAASSAGASVAGAPPSEEGAVGPAATALGKDEFGDEDVDGDDDGEDEEGEEEREGEEGAGGVPASSHAAGSLAEDASQNLSDRMNQIATVVIKKIQTDVFAPQGLRISKDYRDIVRKTATVLGRIIRNVERKCGPRQQVIKYPRSEFEKKPAAVAVVPAQSEHERVAEAFAAAHPGMPSPRHVVTPDFGGPAPAWSIPSKPSSGRFFFGRDEVPPRLLPYYSSYSNRGKRVRQDAFSVSDLLLIQDAALSVIRTRISALIPAGFHPGEALIMATRAICFQRDIVHFAHDISLLSYANKQQFAPLMMFLDAVANDTAVSSTSASFVGFAHRSLPPLPDNECAMTAPDQDVAMAGDDQPPSSSSVAPAPVDDAAAAVVAAESFGVPPSEQS